MGDAGIWIVDFEKLGKYSRREKDENLSAFQERTSFFVISWRNYRESGYTFQTLTILKTLEWVLSIHKIEWTFLRFLR
jgi:hypothetical protein